MLGIDPRAARATWTVILIALLCLTIYAIRNTLFIFIVSLLFAYLLLPLVDFIDRFLPWRRSRGPALVIVYIFLVAGLVSAGIVIGSRVAEQANNLAQKLAIFLKEQPPPPQPPPQDLRLPQPLKPVGDQILSVMRSTIQDHYQEILQTLPQTILRFLSVASNLVYLVIVPILSFFFLKDGRSLQRSIVAQVEDNVRRSVLGAIAADLNVLLAQYMRALVLLGLAASIAYGAFFSIMGVPYALLLAALAFPLEFIPMIGPLSSAIIILLVAGFSGYPHGWALAAFLGVYRIFQDYVLSPHLMSSGMELHPLLVVFGVFAGEQIAGIPGAFLSVPVMAVLRMIYSRLERARTRQEIAAEPTASLAK
jgi:predicted PurR-regulated permease PerM